MTGPSWLMLATLITRLVPLLFILSATVAGMRFFHDLLVRRHAWAARIAAVSCLIAGSAFALPLTARMSIIYGAESAFREKDWPLAERRFALYEQLGGGFNYRTHFEYGLSLLNTGEFARAIPHFQSALADPTGGLVVDARFFGALCLYKTGKFDQVAAAMREIPRRFPFAAEAHYLLARVHARAKRPGPAVLELQRSLSENPDFAPALYEITRMAVLGGSPQVANAAIDASARRHRNGDRDPFIQYLKASIARGEVLPDREFL